MGLCAERGGIPVYLSTARRTQFGHRKDDFLNLPQVGPNQRRSHVKNSILIAMSFLTMLAVMPAFGQTAANERRVNVPFKFSAGDTVLPAGLYEITYDSGRPWVVNVRNSNDNKTVAVRIITLLARDSSSKEKIRLVFDTAGEQQFLSEVWLPGRDGFLVRGKAEEHKHKVVKAAD